MPKRHIDPEYERWKRKYPAFPGVAKCVELLRQTNVQGEWIDIICFELQDHATEDPAELIEAIRAPENKGVRLILLGVLENAAVPEAIPLFSDVLQSGDESERDYAIRGLEEIDTKEARTVLWRAGVR